MSPNGHLGSHPIGEAGKAWYCVDQVGDCAVVTAGGEIDQETAPALEDALQVARSSPPGWCSTWAR